MFTSYVYQDPFRSPTVYDPYVGYFYGPESFAPYYRTHPVYYPYYQFRQHPIQGQATWTEGGKVTKCGLPWSKNEFMTAAVGDNSPYKCGQTLKVKNPSTAKEVIVTVVDQVAGFPPNKLNLHKTAFEALGASPDLGVINIEINPSPALEKEKWGKYLLEVTQTAYPSYSITDYKKVKEKKINSNQMKETYDFVLVSPQEKLKVRGNVIYNTKTERIVSFNIKEL